jgi:hypothetical protein
LAALLEFKQEEQQRLEEFNRLEKEAEQRYQDIKEKGMALFKEDWQLSQFWVSSTGNHIVVDWIYNDSMI